MSTDFRKRLFGGSTIGQAATREELIPPLQSLSGRSLRTRAEIDAYLAHVAALPRVTLIASSLGR